MSDLLGCGDSLCYIEKPRGMATNGGCRCRPYKLNIALMRLRKRVEELEKQATNRNECLTWHLARLDRYRTALERSSRLPCVVKVGAEFGDTRSDKLATYCGHCIATDVLKLMGGGVVEDKPKCKTCGGSNRLDRGGMGAGEGSSLMEFGGRLGATMRPIPCPDCEEGS